MNVTSTLDFQMASTDPEVIGAMQCLINACMVAIVVEKSGHKRVLGTPNIPAKIESAEATSGKTSEDLRGVTFQLKSFTGKAAPFYTGTIDLDPLT